MEEYCQKHIKDYKQENGFITGFLEGELEYGRFKDNLCKFGYSFAVRNSTNRTKVTDASSSRQHLVDHDYTATDSTRPINFDYGSGVFYYRGELIYMVCAHGKNYYKKETAASHQDHSTTKRSRRPNQNTKKMDCPAVLKIKERIVFQDHMKSGKVYYALKRKEAAKICQKIAEGDHPAVITRYYVMMSTYHSHDITLQNMNIHPKISSRIHELVEKGFTSVKEVKLLLIEKVDEMFPEEKPDKMNSAYYPSDRTIYSHIADTLLKIKKNKFDQEDHQFDIAEWQNETSGASFYFRPCRKDSKNELKQIQETVREVLMEGISLSYDTHDLDTLKTYLKNAIENNKILASGERSAEETDAINYFGATKRRMTQTEEIPQRKKN